MARDAIAGHDVWVYRSAPSSSAAAPESPRADAPRAEPPLVEPAPARPDREAPAKERSAPGWIATGIGVMVMPFTLTIMAMIAPALWIYGSRPRR